jgi:transposase InsO family protein
MDRTTDGRPVKMLTRVDEYTRQCLLIHPARSITSGQVLDILQRLADLKGAPAHIRSDNGSEFIAHIIQDWCHTADVQTLYIEPGSPWKNPFIESFHSRFRDECLNQEIFFSIAETRVVVEDYRRLYNRERPHSSLGYKTPDEFAQNLTVQPADTRQTSHPK